MKGFREQKILVKEADLKTIPPSYSHKFLPILFAEPGTFHDFKGKKKKCFVVVYPSGIGFFATHAGVGVMDSDFFPTYAISELVWTNPKERAVVTMRSSVGFICDHPDDAVSCLLASRAILFAGCADPSPIRLFGFPGPIPPAPTPPLDCTLSQLRYLCRCFQFGVPPAEVTLSFFRGVDPDRNPVLLLDERSGPAPEDLRCLLRPLVQLGTFRGVHLHGFAPFACCRVVRSLLKHVRTVRTVVFEGFSSLHPCQLRMGALKPDGPLSFVFVRCPFSEGLFGRLVDELGSFAGEYQRLTLGGLKMTARMLRDLVEALRRGRCFRALEVLELDGIDVRMVDVARVAKRLGELMKTARFLVRFAVADWPDPVPMQLAPFMCATQLAELALTKLDMGHPLADFDVPPNLRLLNLSQCNFTWASLNSLFRHLARVKTPLTLVMQDLAVPEVHWTAFMQNILQLPRLSCVQELDWGGNRLPGPLVGGFVEYFFQANPIKFLGLDRIFRAATVSELQKLFDALPQRLWGVSLCGESGVNFAGYFKEFTKALDTLGDISILHIDSQKFTEMDAANLLQYFERHPKLFEMLCDNSTVNSQQTFLDFYRRICDLEVGAIGRPFQDTQRLFGRNLQGIETVRAAIQRRHNRSTQLVRACFMATHALDMGEMHKFAASFPPCLLPLEVTDSFGHRGKREAPDLSSLLSNAQFTSLADIHEAVVSDAWRPPLYSPEWTRMSLDPDGNSPDPPQAPAVPADPVWDVPEIWAAVRELAGAPGEEEEAVEWADDRHLRTAPQSGGWRVAPAVHLPLLPPPNGFAPLISKAPPRSSEPPRKHCSNVTLPSRPLAESHLTLPRIDVPPMRFAGEFPPDLRPPTLLFAQSGELANPVKPPPPARPTSPWTKPMVLPGGRIFGNVTRSVLGPNIPQEMVLPPGLAPAAHGEPPQTRDDPTDGR
jgi:hypothetical protein